MELGLATLTPPTRLSGPSSAEVVQTSGTAGESTHIFTSTAPWVGPIPIGDDPRSNAQGNNFAGQPLPPRPDPPPPSMASQLPPSSTTPPVNTALSPAPSDPGPSTNIKVRHADDDPACATVPSEVRAMHVSPPSVPQMELDDTDIPAIDMDSDSDEEVGS